MPSINKLIETEADYIRAIFQKAGHTMPYTEARQAIDYHKNQIIKHIEKLDTLLMENDNSDTYYVRSYLTDEMSLTETDADMLIQKYRRVVNRFLNDDSGFPVEDYEIAESLVRNDELGVTEEEWLKHIRDIDDAMGWNQND